MKGYNTSRSNTGESHRCAHGYHNKCDRPGCACPCHQEKTPTKTGLPTPNNTT